MKTVKEGEVRKREIFLAARELFIKQGYEQTSINDILHVVDIAKGTFYYYFSSKEEILQAIILDIVEEGARRAEHIMKDQSIPLLNRILIAIFAQAPEFEGSQVMQEELHRVENAKLERMYQKAMLKRMTAVLEGAITEGIDQGIFHTEYPKECLEAVLLLGHMLFDCNLMDWEMSEYPLKLQAYLSNIERMAGIQEGELQNIFEKLKGSK